MKKIIMTIIIGTAFTQAHIDEKDLNTFVDKFMTCQDTYKKNKMAPPLG